RLVQLFSRDAGKREAKLVFDCGQGTQDLGFRNEINVLFDCKPAVKVELEVLDDDGKTPVTGQFVFRDARGRVYPAQSRRLAPDMMRQVLGEDLNVGCVLSWGPCWYFQKQFFDGKVSPLSTDRHVMRYDVEVSGFPSSHAGHLCLLRLKDDDYPGTTRIEQWPSWDLPVLKWGKSQGGVVGFSHSGWGLQTKDMALPTLEIPPYKWI